MTRMHKHLYVLGPFSEKGLKPTQPGVMGEGSGSYPMKLAMVRREESSLLLRAFSLPGTHGILLSHQTPLTGIIISKESKETEA